MAGLPKEQATRFFYTQITQDCTAQMTADNSWLKGVMMVGSFLLSNMSLMSEAQAADTVGPTLTITQPVTGATIPATGLTAQGTASDASGIRRVRLYLFDYTRYAYTVSNATASYDAATQTWSFPLAAAHVSP
ncbi:MAG: Ig-like domain-containing protein, partial [Candidatus Omnitrophica bacterium]|nr:Ig-like domain-containing protein [Candidatus Omnitrophota bacterium]